MKIFIIIPVLLVLPLFLPMALIGGEQDEVQNAVAFSENVTFRAEGALILNDTAIPLVMYQYKAPEDGFVFRRLEFFPPEAASANGVPTRINIVNRNGMFDSTVDGGKTSEAMNPFDLARKISPALSCSAEQESDRKIYTFSAGSEKAGSIILHVGRDNPFIYGIRINSGNGREELVFNKVDFDYVIAPELFKETRPEVSLSGILKEAFKRTWASTFIAKASIDDKEYKDSRYTIYQKYDSVNNFTCQREDFLDGTEDNVLAVDLIIPEGTFCYSKYFNSIIKRVDLHHKYYFLWPPHDTLLASSWVTAKDIEFEGIKCWEFAVETKSSHNCNRAIYIVGKDNYFIYSWRYFKKDGTEYCSVTLKDVKFDPEFPEGCFEVPSGEIKETHNDDGFRAALNNRADIPEKYRKASRKPWKYLVAVEVTLAAAFIGLVAIKIIRRKRLNHNNKR